MKKLFSFLALLFIMNSLLIAQVAVAPAIGDGTEENPYQIASLENLYWIAADNDVVPEPDYTSRMSFHYLQIAEIDATETQNWFGGQGWKPIGFDYYSPFAGSYNGQDHTIEALYINRENSNFIGLFGYSNGANINNLGIVNSSFIGNEFVGGLVGSQLNSTISNSYCTGSVHGNNYIGGLAGGHANDSIINNSYSIANVTGYGYVGGLVGWQDTYSSISNSYSTVNVIGDTQVGGLVGFMANSSSINSSYSTGYVSGAGGAVGGLVGGQSVSTINGSYSTCSVSGNSQIGGLVGWQGGSTISNSFSTGNVTGSSRVGGLVGNPINSKVENSYYNYESVLINNENIITIGALDYETYNTWFDNGFYLNIDDYLIYDEGNYLINSVDDLAKLLAFGQFEDYSYKLTSNLDLGEHPNFFVPYLRGNFDGNGFIIDNLMLNMESYSRIALFGYVNRGTIENLGVTNVHIVGDWYVGGLVGYQYDNSVINNCNSTGNVNGNFRVGGLVGHKNYYSIVSNSFSTGSITGLYFVGGLIGYQSFNCIISNSYCAGSVTGNRTVGGLVGHHHGSITSNSYSTKSVIGDEMVGGLAGWIWASTITNSYSIGSVSGESDTGGFAGYGWGTFTNSYWNIETSGQTTSAGGEGRTTAEMTFPYAENTYIDWDFTEIWAADEDYEVNNGYPFLREDSSFIEEDNLITPSASLSLSNYPNPFNPTTTIQFSSELFEPNEQIMLEIFNIKGQKIRQFNIQNSQLKINEIVWNGEDSRGKPVSSGVYLYRVEAKNSSATRKMILLK
jgi:hypothetical protein